MLIFLEEMESFIFVTLKKKVKHSRGFPNRKYMEDKNKFHNFISLGMRENH